MFSDWSECPLCRKIWFCKTDEEKIGISVGSGHTITHDCLDFLKFCEFVSIFDETWVHYFTPESNIWRFKLRFKLSSPPKKFTKFTIRCRKIIASVLWDLHDLIFVDFVPREGIINIQYYSNLQKNQARRAIRKKRSGKHSKKRSFCFTKIWRW